MNEGIDLIVTLTGSLAAALGLGYVTQRLGWSPIVGYLLSGVLVGPHTPGFVADRHVAEQLAEVGVILLMFGVGLQFHFEHLVNVWRVALPGAILQSLCATLLAALVTRMFGWTWPAGLVFGAALSVASTVVLVRVLADNRDLETPTGRIAVGWLVIEDLFTVLLLVLLPAVVADSTFDARLGAALGITLLKVTTLVVIVFLLGQRAIPWLLERAAATRSREIFTLTILVVALGLAVGSARFFGVSMALGAFLAGMIVGRTEYSSQAAAEAMPMRDAFAVLFFVSVGMLLEPGFLITSPLLVAATLAVVLIGKPLAALAVVRLMGYSRRVAVGVGVSLAQVGEFSFILASVGHELGVLSAAATQTIVAAAIISIMLNPVLYRLAQRLQLDDDESLTPDPTRKAGAFAGHRLRDLMVFSTLAGLLITLGGLVSPRHSRPGQRRVGRGLEWLLTREQQSGIARAIDTRIEAEYREMPGMGLTVPQAARLFGLDSSEATASLERLEVRRVLRRTSQGRFVLGDGASFQVSTTHRH